MATKKQRAGLKKAARVRKCLANLKGKLGKKHGGKHSLKAKAHCGSKTAKAQLKRRGK